MAIYKVFQVTATGSALNLDIGFVPSYMRVVNQTKLAAQGGVAISEWYYTMLNGYALIQTLTTGAPVYSQITSNGFTPYQTLDSGLWKATNKTISDISNAANAEVEITAHGFTADDVGVTTLTFSGVVGMIQINTLRGVIQSIVDSNNITVNINTSSFSSYVSGGIANVITGIPAGSIYIGETAYPIGSQPYIANSSGQYLNTAQQNLGAIGMTLGSTICGSSTNILLVQAVLDAPFTS